MLLFDLLPVTTAVLALLGSAQAATPAEWRSHSIYQVFTDRFAKTDLSTTASCPSGYGGYCGGTWQGIISMLDYIQVCCDSRGVGNEKGVY
jgi:alpha-amylase